MFIFSRLQVQLEKVQKRFIPPKTKFFWLLQKITPAQNLKLTEAIIWGIPLAVRSGFKYPCLIAVSWQDNNGNFQMGGMLVLVGSKMVVKGEKKDK